MEAGEEGAPTLALSISALMMLPLKPVPWTPDTSTPFWSAAALARGEMKILSEEDPAEDWKEVGAAEGVVGAEVA